MKIYAAQRVPSNRFHHQIDEPFSVGLSEAATAIVQHLPTNALPALRLTSKFFRQAAQPLVRAATIQSKEDLKRLPNVFPNVEALTIPLSVFTQDPSNALAKLTHLHQLILQVGYESHALSIEQLKPISKQLRALEIVRHGPLYSRLNADVLAQLPEMPALETMIVREQPIVHIPNNLSARLPMLSRLEFHHCMQLPKDAIARLGVLPQLQALSFVECSQLNALPHDLGERFANLIKLNLSRCTNLPANSIVHLAALSQLRELCIAGCWRFNKIPNSLDQCFAALQSWNSSGCFQLPRRLIAGLGKRPHLQELNLNDCVSLDVLPESFSEHFPALIHLNLTKCNELPANLLQRLGTLPSLQTLHLDQCKQLNAVPNHFAKCFPALRQLLLGRCTNLPGNILQLLGTLPHLQTLALDQCKQLIAAPNHFIDCFPALRQLYLSGCTGLPSDLVHRLASLPTLQTLVLDQCKQLNSLPDRFSGCWPSLSQLSWKGCNQLASFDQLGMAARSGRLMLVEALIEALGPKRLGSPPSTEQQINQREAILRDAITAGHCQVVNALMPQFELPALSLARGLLLALRRGDVEMIKTLHAHNARLFTNCSIVELLLKEHEASDDQEAVQLLTSIRDDSALLGRGTLTAAQLGTAELMSLLRQAAEQAAEREAAQWVEEVLNPTAL